MTVTTRLDFSGLADEVDVSLDAFSQEFIQDLAFEVVDTTPYQTGYLRSRWFQSVGEPDANNPAPRTSRGNQNSINAASLFLNTKEAIAAGTTLYILNDAEYAARREFGFTGTDSLGRTYADPGSGWIRAATVRAMQIGEETAARIKRGGI